MASQRFFRIVGKGRSGDKALRSSAGRFHDEPYPTSYVAMNLETAWKEIQAGVGTVRPNPDAFHAFEVLVQDPDLEDLAEDPSLLKLMRDPHPPEGKKIARELRNDGLDGMIYPSMRAVGEESVVLFLENLGSRVEIKPVPSGEWRRFVEAMTQ